jgi:peptidoglycan/LPS O-acetylase OafA/YrhL
MTSLGYRADIDGLRAVAVLGVVIYHAFPHALPGGFIGVDIFFVISGYLISGILYKGNKEGNFSYQEFYARRIRRLFPALITVLLITLAYGWLILLPDEFEQLGKNVAAGMVFAQNFVFWKESGYFDTAANLKPLLHLWSLAVEEQFYIFFPLLLIFLWKKPRILAPAMVVLLIATFILNVVMSIHANGASDFYLLPCRSWEFLGGSLLAWWHYDRGHEEEVNQYREAMSWVGVLLLGIGMGLFAKHQPYPGWRALLPVVGTLLVIEGGKEAWVNQRILSHPAIVWVGLISYPLYLFHWPALSFVHIVKGEKAPTPMIWAALGVAFLLTLLTYYVIEKQIRHNRSLKTVPLLVVAFVFTGIFGGLVKLNIIKSKTNPLSSDKAYSIEYITLCDSVLYKQIGGSGKQTLFVGDSNMEMYFPRINNIIKNSTANSRGAQFVIARGIPPIKGFESIKFKGCKNLIPEAEKILKKDTRVDRVVIAACWVSYFRNQDKNDIFNYSYNGGNPESLDVRKIAIDSFGEMIKKFTTEGKKVFIVLNTPVGEKLNPNENLYNRGFLSNTYYPKIISIKSFKKEYGDLIDQISDAATKAGAKVIDPIPYLTYEGNIITCDSDGPIRKDAYHLKARFVEKEIKYLDQIISD